MVQITRRNTSEFLNNEVKEFAISVIKNRSLPSIMDGQRMGGRKILYAAMSRTFKKKGKEKAKMVNLIGDTMNLEFHHGDISLKNTIESLSAKHLYKYCPFEVIGQMGTLRYPETKTAARYLTVRQREYLEWFKVDSELFEHNYEDGTKVEPKNFYPIVPITLLWRTNSPGFGFSFRSFSFNLDDIIDATIMSIINGSCSGLNYIQLRPEIVGIKPENIIYNENKKCWYNVGEYHLDYDNDILHITDLPYNVYIEKYREHLAALKDKGYIVGITDNTKGDAKSASKSALNINIKVKFAKGRLAILSKEKFKFFGAFKLYTKIPKLTLNCIDIDGKSIISFATPNDLVDGFVRRRLNIYRKRKTHLISVLEQKLAELDDLIRFIQLVVDDKIIVNNRKKSEIVKDCEKFGVTTKGLELRISKLTMEEIIELKEEYAELDAYLKYIINTTVQEMYINDLIEFKSTYLQIHNGLRSTATANNKQTKKQLDVIEI